MGIPVGNDHFNTFSFANNQAVVVQDKEDLIFMLRKLQTNGERVV